MLQLIAYFTVASLIISLLLKRWKYYRCSYFLPGPTALPLIGNALNFACKNEELLWKIHDQMQKYPHPMRFWLGPQLIVAFSDPQHVEKILTSEKFAHKDNTYKFLKRILGDGLISGSGPKWKSHRKIIQRLISLKFINRSIGLFQNKLEICLQNLDAHVDGSAFDVHDVLLLYAVDCFGELIAGVQVDSQVSNENLSFINAFEVKHDLVFERTVKPWLHSDFLYNLTANGIKFKNVSRVLWDFVQKAIQTSNIRRTQSAKDDEKVQPIIDQIGHYIDENPGSVNDVDYNHHIMTLYAASADTVAVVTSFTCLCLGMYPEYQQKAYDDIQTTLGDLKRDLTTNDVSKLTYLDMCIKEVMRLTPIAPYIARKTVEDVEIDNLLIPENTGVLIPIFNIHRDPKYWDHPNEFYPDHFLPQNTKGRPEYTYLPFSAGIRGCIGKTFATLVLKLILANILSRYTIETDGKIKDLKLKQDISVRPVHGFRIRLKERKR